MHKLEKSRIAALLCVYFIVYVFGWQMLLSQWVYYGLGEKWYYAGDVLSYVFFFFVFIAIGGSWLREQWKTFIGHFPANLLRALKTVLLLFAAEIVLSIVLMPYQLSDPENQINNLVYMQRAFLPFLIGSLLFAPFTEELIFRGCLCWNFTEKHFLFGALLSSAAFGFVHIGASLLSGNTVNVLYFFLYAPLGFVLALPLKKSKTVFTGMLAHMLYNLAATLLSL